MGYRVEYGPVKKVRGLEKRVSRVSALTGLFLLLFLFLTVNFWPKGAETVKNMVLPGDPAVTAAAWEDMTDQLREGEELSDALHYFCVRILEGAELDSDR